MPTPKRHALTTNNRWRSPYVDTRSATECLVPAPRRARLAVSIPFIVICAVCLFAKQGWSADTIELTNGQKPLSGEVTGVSRTEVTIEVGLGRKEKTVPANEVANIRWNDEPTKLKVRRSDEQQGRLKAALEGYEEMHKQTRSTSRFLKADLEFLIARTLAKMALVDSTQLEDAIAKLEAFRKNHSRHYRYYDALEHLGQVYVLAKDSKAGQDVFAEMVQAPWPEYQIGARVALARMQLLEGDVETALAAFDAVIEQPAKTPAEKVRRLEALLGKAGCLQQMKKHAEAADLLAEVTRDAAAENTALQAEAYLRKGDNLRLSGKTKAALLAYLHVDLLFSGESDMHAEALLRLTQLWTAVERPARAADAASRLRQQYPGSQWSKQLASG